MDVHISTDACGTYCGAMVEGLRNDASPEWMVRLLEAVWQSQPRFAGGYHQFCHARSG